MAHLNTLPVALPATILPIVDPRRESRAEQKMNRVADLSALFRPTATAHGSPSETLHTLSPWTVDDGEGSSVSATHSHFTPAAGRYVAARDGLYAVSVAVIPIGGGALMEGALKRRRSAHYVVVIDAPDDADPDADDAGSEFLDVGPVRFGEVLYLRAGAAISVAALPGTPRRDSVRLSVALVQRKRLREEAVPLTKKEWKKLKKQKRRLERAANADAKKEEAGETAVKDDDVKTEKVKAKEEDVEGQTAPQPRKRNVNDEEDSDSDWSAGFSSDRSDDHLQHSKRGVRRLAKRLKSAGAGDPA